MTPRTLRTVPQVADSCRHQPLCPGCPRFGSVEICSPALEELQQFAAPFGLQVIPVLGDRSQFRRRARLSVRGRANSPKLGVFEAHSHRVIDIAHCSVHHPMVNCVTRELKAAMQQLRVPPYSDRAHAGLVRGVQIVIQRPKDQAQITLICNATDPASAQPLLQELRRRLAADLHSLWWNGNSELTNRVLGSAWEKIAGPDAVEECLGGARVFFPPGAFGQNNLDLFDRLLAQIHSWIPDGAEVLELYCGTGSIGLGLVGRVKSIVFNEIGAASLQGLDAGLSALAPDLRARTSVAPGTAETLQDQIQSHHTVIVDPPRKGLDEGIVQALTSRPPQRLVYVSCGLSSFLRDAQRLADAGLTPRQLFAYDLFPFTDHVETLALFEPTT